MKRQFTLTYEGKLIFSYVVEKHQKFVAIPLTPMVICSLENGIEQKAMYFCNGTIITDFSKLKQKWETTK